MEEKKCIEQHKTPIPQDAPFVPEKRWRRPGRLGMTLLLAILLLGLLSLIWVLSTRSTGLLSSNHQDGYCDTCGRPSVYTGCGVEYCKTHLDHIVDWYLLNKRPNLSTCCPDTGRITRMLGMNAFPTHKNKTP